MHATIADLLLAIEMELRALSLWSDQAPTAEQLASTEPFCLDTLTFPQWIQFVFIVRLKVIVEQGGAFPEKSTIAPMVEEYFRGSSLDVARLTQLMAEFDRLVSTR